MLLLKDALQLKLLLAAAVHVVELVGRVVVLTFTAIELVPLRVPARGVLRGSKSVAFFYNWLPGRKGKVV
jgi:hypothetical protein